MTQRDLAGERYTPAYISALETGGAKPSMAALHYIADRLGADVRGFLGTSTGISNRAVADLDLAAGDYPKAVDEYRSLLDGTLPAQERPLVLLGLAEALCRLDRGREALTIASEAQERLSASGRPVEAALAGYWLAAAQFQADNSAESKSLLLRILEEVRGGLNVTADFRMRLLVAVAMNESADGEHEHALAYQRRPAGSRVRWTTFGARATCTTWPSSTRKPVTMRAPYGPVPGRGPVRAAESEREIAALENLTALIYNDLGNATGPWPLWPGPRRSPAHCQAMSVSPPAWPTRRPAST